MKDIDSKKLFIKKLSQQADDNGDSQEPPEVTTTDHRYTADPRT
jgi:hypothetical protein